MTSHLLLLIGLLASCTSLNQDKKDLAWEKWKGLPVSSLDKHPYFKQLPVSKIQHSEGHETWLYKDQSRFQTGAYCQSMGGCVGVSIYNCENAFSIKDGLILSYEQKGSCPSLKTIEAPTL